MILHPRKQMEIRGCLSPAITLCLWFKIMRPMPNTHCISWQATWLHRLKKLFGNGWQVKIRAVSLGRFPTDARKRLVTLKMKFKRRFSNEKCRKGNQSGSMYEFAA